MQSAVSCCILLESENVMYRREDLSKMTNVYLCSVNGTPLPDVSFSYSRLTEVARRIALESRGNHVVGYHSLTPCS